MNQPIHSVGEILERIFTSVNPATGSTPPSTAWVIYAHGTVFFSGTRETLPADASFGMIADAARSAFSELGPVQAGTPSADFNPIRMHSWFPDEPVWFVRFDHEDIFTAVTLD